MHLAPHVEEKLGQFDGSASGETWIEKTVDTIKYLVELISSNTTLQEKDCATIFSFIVKLIRG